MKHGGGSVMVWGFISGNGMRKIVRVDGNVTSDVYCNILKDNLLPYIDCNNLFQQDGAPAHRALATKVFLEENGVALLPDWPGQSPDLNIIENFWEILKKKVAESRPSNINEVWETVEIQFYAVSDEYICKLYGSLPKIMFQVIRNKGFATKY